MFSLFRPMWVNSSFLKKFKVLNLWKFEFVIENTKQTSIKIEKCRDKDIKLNLTFFRTKSNISS